MVVGNGRIGSRLQGGGGRGAEDTDNSVDAVHRAHAMNRSEGRVRVVITGCDNDHRGGAGIMAPVRS